MFETTIPNAISVYKKVKRLVGATPTSGRIRIGMTDTDMKLVFENKADYENIGKVLIENGILAPKVQAPVERQRIYNPPPKVHKTEPVKRPVIKRK